MVGENLNTKSCITDSLFGHTLTNGLFASKLSSSVRKIIFVEQEFLISKPVSDVKYHYPSFLNYNLFDEFNDQLDYALTNNFAESKTTKANINRFLFNSLMSPLFEKLSYQNANECIEKLSDILWSIQKDE